MDNINGDLIWDNIEQGLKKAILDNIDAPTDSAYVWFKWHELPLNVRSDILIDDYFLCKKLLK